MDGWMDRCVDDINMFWKGTDRVDGDEAMREQGSLFSRCQEVGQEINFKNDIIILQMMCASQTCRLGLEMAVRTESFVSTRLLLYVVWQPEAEDASSCLVFSSKYTKGHQRMIG